MWFYGTVDVPREKLFRLKSVKKNATWHTLSSPYDVPLQVSPYAFAYAAMRTSIVGTRIGLRGAIAGAGLSVVAAAYLERISSSLEFHSLFGNVKDFVGAGIKGTVGAAFAYLYMLKNDYVWCGHWEDVVTGAPAGPRPDFVFASDSDVCLVDAKGSAAAQLDVERLVKDEWKRQIWPHRGTHLHLGGTCTEGTVIATAVAPGAGARFVRAHGRFPRTLSAKTVSNTTSTTNAIKSVQRANYINAFFLLGLPQTAFALIDDLSPLRNFDLELKRLGRKGELVLGPPRLVIAKNQASYLMRPVGHIPILQQMAFNLGPDVPYEIPPQSEFILTSPIDDGSTDDGPTEFTIQGRDGIGAQFTQV